MPLFPTFPGLPIPGRNIQRFCLLKVSSFSDFSKSYPRRFGQPHEARLLFLRQWKVITSHTIVKTVSRSQLTGASAGARLLKRVFDVDVEHCPNCGGALKIIAAIDDPPVIVKILSHLGLPTRGPPRAPARRVDLFQTI